MPPMRLLAAAGLLAALVLGSSGCAGTPAERPRATPSPAGIGWTEIAASPLTPRHDPLIAAIDGRFLVIGGSTGQACPPSASCIRADTRAESDGAAYDPATDAWTPIADAPVPLSSHRWTVLGSDLYLVSQDLNGNAVEHFLRYEAAADAWTRLPMPPSSPSGLTVVSERIVAIAERDQEDRPAVDAVFDPATGRWTRLPDDPRGPGYERTGVWVDGRLLLTDKQSDQGPGEAPIIRVASLDASLRIWERLPDSAVVGGGAIAVGDRLVLPMLGDEDGGGWGGSYDYGGVYDPRSGDWSALPSALEECIRDRGAGAMVGSPALVAGRRVITQGCAFDPSRGSVTELPPAEWDPRFAGGQAASTGSILVWGGADAERNLADGHLLRLDR